MKIVVDQEDGFSFGEAVYPVGGVYGPLTGNYVALLLVHEGTAKATCDGKITIVEAGECGLFLGEQLSVFEYEKGTRNKVGWCEAFPANLPDSAALSLRNATSKIPISARIETLQRLGLGLTQGSDADTNILCETLGQSLLAAYFHEAQISERERHTPRSIHRARRYLEENFAKELTLGQLADMLALTPQHLVSSFRKHIGVTPVRYLWQIRANHGRQLLLHSELPVMEIAERCGYKNPYHFSRQIRLHFGMSPTELRAQAAHGISREPTAS
ncbi:AraC family L-rhamnose operon regulatory protein RhaS [Aminobacter niigataensis]|uniref:AraC family L-rhamnose operon regulatory protein RhaS n=1 Tax=Aminobacter niigataensis TaxID=83265 RepID=A0ABR6KZG3_9HYPH|nr:AraC family transcriptional regulator [Aminobacter niigataensis]MBB4649938.1 AraC family L-rhamnose operon regulatory protein RhaS [Aminobacter niigataensis]